MWMLAWLAGLVLASSFFARWQDQRFNPNPQPVSRHAGQTVEVRLQANPQGHFVCSGMINGQPVELLVDTGATDVAIPAALARQLRLEAGPPSLQQTAGGTVSGYLTWLDRLQLGDILLRHVRAVVMPDFPGQAVLLGMSALRQLEFTQQQQTLVLRQSVTEPS